MTDTSASMIRARPFAAAAIAVAVVGAAAILGAWYFQYVLGLKPCPLCLEQRYAYYFAVPLAVLVLLGDQYGASRKVLIAALVAIAAGMLWNAGLGVYHSGIEWKWWPGPQECSGTGAQCRARRQSHRAAAVVQRRALRRGGVAVPRLVARRLQRADLAAAGGSRRIWRDGWLAHAPARRRVAGADVAARLASGALTAPARCPNRDNRASCRADSWAGKAGRCGAGGARSAGTASATGTCAPRPSSCCPW